jgi:hypothetical protein
MKKLKYFFRRLISYIKMKTITKILYVREEDIPLTKTRKSFLRQFLEKRSSTYHKNGNIQCDSRSNRSISEVTSIIRSRFPITSVDAVIRIIAELNKDGRCYLVWCTQVNKFVVVGGYNETNPCGKNFITNYSRKYYGEKIGVDGISYSQLIEIRKDQLSL